MGLSVALGLAADPAREEDVEVFAQVRVLRGYRLTASVKLVSGSRYLIALVSIGVYVHALPRSIRLSFHSRKVSSGDSHGAKPPFDGNSSRT